MSKTCPVCGADDVLLIDSEEFDTWEIDEDEYDEDAEVWVCQNFKCSWHEEAELDEALEYHVQEYEWILGRVAEIQRTKKEGKNE
jgi:hypothetical protein